MDSVNHPGHYALHYPLEVKDMIEIILINAYGPDAYKAYCLGNELKYRLRAGFKGEIGEEIGKAMKYLEFREEAAEESRDDLVFNDHSERTAARDVEDTVRWRQGRPSLADHDERDPHEKYPPGHPYWGPDHTYTDEEPEYLMRHTPVTPEEDWEWDSKAPSDVPPLARRYDRKHG
jgi:hypothetical protein